MSFKVDIRDYSQSQFKKTKFFKWTPGQHRFRFVEDEAPLIQSYWFGRGFIQANGFDDPQATLNRRIKLENPEDFRNVRGWRPIQDRYYINILDMTPVKICHECEAEVKAVNGTFPALCPECNKGVISDTKVEPLNQIRVLTGGKLLFEQIPTVESQYTDEDGEALSITSYDCVLHVVGTGAQRTSVVLADVDEDQQPKVYEVEVPPEDLYDLQTIVPKVDDAEMEQLISGVSLRDIFTARKATDEDSDDEETPKADPAEVQKRVDELFA
jgi:hypothetical protein